MKVSTLLKIQTAIHLIAFFLMMLYAAEHSKYILVLPSVLLLVLGLAGIMAIGPQRELEGER